MHTYAVQFLAPQDNREVYVFRLADGSLLSHLKASLLEKQQRGAEI
jgi:hypothetical protein